MSAKYAFAKTSPVTVFFTGDNHAGSWEMRGDQISRCRTNWNAHQELTASQIVEGDIFCFVKRPIAKVMQALRKKRKIVVFDIVDSWTQPQEGLQYTTLPQALDLFRRKWEPLNAHAYLFPNHAMLQDLRTLVPRATFIYHHYRPEYEAAAPVREVAKVVGYEGNATYLGPWAAVLEKICAKKGLQLQINPSTLSDVDIGFAARGGEHASFLANRYKSNVKLANFYGAGVPCVVHADEQSYQETDNGSVLFFRDEAQLESQIERLRDAQMRREIQKRFLEHRGAFHLSTIADQYEHFFHFLKRSVKDE